MNLYNKMKQTTQIKESYCLNNKISLIPLLNESEKFIKFLGNKFKLDIPKDLIITISKTKPNVKGFFSWNLWENDNKEKLKNINLNTFHLKTTPYTTLAHELAHFINHNKDIKDCSSNQYHNKHFKTQAEKFFLKVIRTKKGYSHTERTEEFNLMLKEFKAEENVFNVLEIMPNKSKKVVSRLFLFECEDKCFKVRSGNKELDITCNLCNTKFKRVIKE